MREQDPSPRRRAARLLGLLTLVLVGASLLAPDAVDTWADTRDAGWERDTTRAWADPMGKLSRRLSLDAPLRYVEDLLDRAAPAVADPAVRPAPVTSSTPEATSNSQAPSSSEALLTNEAPTTSQDRLAFDAPPITRPPRVADTDQPLRILAVGDSLMLDLQYGLERVLGQRSDVRVVGKGALGFGFTVPHWDWDDDVLVDYDRLVADVAPDVVVVMIGANEFEGHAIEGVDLVPGSRQWREILALRADQAIAHWRAGGAHVYWWTTPRMRDARYLTDDLNAIWIETTDAWGAGATMIESMAILGDNGGSYREVLRDETGAEVPLRKEHGVHFHEVGADLLARQLEDRLVRDGWVASRS